MIKRCALIYETPIVFMIFAKLKKTELAWFMNYTGKWVRFYYSH